MVHASKWFQPLKLAPHAQLRLFCFPYAGGSAMAFRSWVNLLPTNWELIAIQMPGRGNRLAEPALTDFTTVVDQLGQEILQFLEKPYLFFGHSMGSLIAFELTRLLWRNYQSLPQGLFVSAHNAPGGAMIKRSQLPEVDFLAEIIKFNGTPPSVLQEPELLKIILPILRADFAVVESYQFVPEAPLKIPVIAYGGIADPEVTETGLAAWGSQTKAGYKYRLFPGDHFYIDQSLPELIRTLVRDVNLMGLSPTAFLPEVEHV